MPVLALLLPVLVISFAVFIAASNACLGAAAALTGTESSSSKSRHQFRLGAAAAAFP